MSISLNKELDLHVKALNLRTERATVLASNIANANTPGYQARDIDFQAALDRSMFSQDELDSSELSYVIPAHPSKDKNTVELGREQAKFAQNVAEYQASLSFIKTKLYDLKKVIAG